MATLKDILSPGEQAYMGMGAQQAAPRPNTLGSAIKEPKDWQKILGIIGGAITSYSGGRPMFTPYMLEQQQRQAEQQQAYDLAEREFQNRLAIEKYKRENPEDPAMAKNFKWWSALPDEVKQLFSQYQDVVQPDFMTGADGQQYQRSRTTEPMPIQISPDDWASGTPLGDAGSNASGGF